MIIFCAIMILLGFIMLIVDCHLETWYLCWISGIIVGVSCMLLGMEKEAESKPSAIDVYRGKTTLEITYKDGVPVDSIVVFKDKEK